MSEEQQLNDETVDFQQETGEVYEQPYEETASTEEYADEGVEQGYEEGYEEEDYQEEGYEEPQELDVDNMTADELRALLTGQDLPEQEEEEYEEDEEYEEGEYEEEEGEYEDEEEGEYEEDGEEVDPAVLEEYYQDIEEFEFSETDNPDILEAEMTSYLANVELTPQIETILDYKDAQIELLSQFVEQVEELGDYENISKTVNAFNQLVTSYRENEQDGSYVPDTTAVRQIFKQEYPQEYEQLLYDELSQGSDKYAGYTKMEEIVRDAFGIQGQAVQHLETFLRSGGQIPVPEYVPRGIDAKVGEAYWLSTDRDMLQGQIERAVFTLEQDPDATEGEKQEARMDIRNVNQKLAQIQAGLNADRNARQFTEQQKMQVMQQVEQEAASNFVETCNMMITNGKERLARALTMFDEPSAELTAMGFSTLVERALTDDEWSRPAQQELRSKGVNFDFNKGKDMLNRLYEVERKIAAQTRAGVNPRAIDISRSEKGNLLRQLQGMEQELYGQITRIAVNGFNNVLTSKMNNAPKVKGVRARGRGDGSGVRPKEGFDNMTVDELRNYVRKNNPYAAALRGDINALS